MSEQTKPESPFYSPYLHYAGAVLWPSFLAACAGTMVFFALFDPSSLHEIATWEITLSRQWGYTIGFFAFWMLSFCSSLLTLLLILPGNKRDKHT